MQEPRCCSVIAYDGIVTGEVPGLWLLTVTLDGLEIPMAVFNSREAALARAAQIDELVGDQNWSLDTVFLNPPDAIELAFATGLLEDEDEEDEDEDEDEDDLEYEAAEEDDWDDVL